MKKLRRWNHLNSEFDSSCLQRRRRRETCVVLDSSPRLTQKETHFDRYVQDNLTGVKLEAADGSGALMIVKTIRLSVGPKSTQEAVRLVLEFFRLDSLRRHYGETLDTSIHTAILESWPGTERFKFRDKQGFFCTKTFEVFCWVKLQV